MGAAHVTRYPILERGNFARYHWIRRARRTTSPAARGNLIEMLGVFCNPKCVQHHKDRAAERFFHPMTENHERQGERRNGSDGKTKHEKAFDRQICAGWFF